MISTMKGGGASNAQRADQNGSNHEDGTRDHTSLANGSRDHASSHDSGTKTLGSYYLKMAIRMLTDYIIDLKTSNMTIDDTVRSRIEEYEALLTELKEKKRQQPDSNTLLDSRDRVKLVPMLLDYQAVLLSEALTTDDQSQADLTDHDLNSQETEAAELRTTKEDSEASGVPVYLSDTDFQEGGYMEPLTAALDLCEKQVQEFVNVLPSVVIFKALCTYVVHSLAPAAQRSFDRYRVTLARLQKQDLEGVQISSSLRNSVSFCFESLVGLARFFHMVADLLKKCGSPEWYRSALELADVRPVKHKRRWSEFSLVIRNCEWRMDLVELAFHALEKLLTEGIYTVMDASFKWCEEKGRMVLQIPGRQSSSQQEACKLLEVSRDLEEKDLSALIEKLEELVVSEKAKKKFYKGPSSALIEKLEKLVVSEKAKKKFYKGPSSAHEIGEYLRKKLSGPTPVVGAYLPYSFTKMDPGSLNYGEYLDIGSAGMVATYDWHEVQVAVKSIRCPSRAKFEEEAAILGMVQHPNVVNFIGYGYIEKANHIDDTGMLVMELMDHDLRCIINARLKVLPEGSNPFSPIVGIDIMLQIGEAMAYLREHSVLHRDLKAKNILVNICKPLAMVADSDSANTSLMRQHPAVSAVLPHTQENYVVKLADFGSAKCRPQSSDVKTAKVGTTGWRAPEVFNTKDESYTWPADVYSFGMLCYEILTGKVPFEGETDHGEGLHAKIMAGVRPPLDNLMRPDVPEALRDLIQQCWATHAEDRPSFDYIVKKLWECKVQAILPGFERQIMHASSKDVH